MGEPSIGEAGALINRATAQTDRPITRGLQIANMNALRTLAGQRREEDKQKADAERINSFWQRVGQSHYTNPIIQAEAHKVRTEVFPQYMIAMQKGDVLGANQLAESMIQKFDDLATRDYQLKLNNVKNHSGLGAYKSAIGEHALALTPEAQAKSEEKIQSLNNNNPFVQISPDENGILQVPKIEEVNINPLVNQIAQKYLDKYAVKDGAGKITYTQKMSPQDADFAAADLFLSHPNIAENISLNDPKFNEGWKKYYDTHAQTGLSPEEADHQKHLLALDYQNEYAKNNLFGQYIEGQTSQSFGKTPEENIADTYDGNSGSIVVGKTQIGISNISQGDVLTAMNRLNVNQKQKESDNLTSEYIQQHPEISNNYKRLSFAVQPFVLKHGNKDYTVQAPNLILSNTGKLFIEAVDKVDGEDTPVTIPMGETEKAQYLTQITKGDKKFSSQKFNEKIDKVVKSMGGTGGGSRSKQTASSGKSIIAKGKVR